MLIKGKIKYIAYNEIADILLQQKFALYENKTFKYSLTGYLKVTIIKLLRGNFIIL